ncbi:MAG: TonB family protein [Daejeonella sp.]
MINFNENLYKDKWLDLVFQNRNKSYGAYALRHQHSETTVKALILASSLFTLLIISPLLYNKFFKANIELKAEVPELITLVNIAPKVIKPVLPPTPIAQKTEPKIKSIANPKMVVVPESEVQIDPPSQIELINSNIGSTNMEGKEVGNSLPVEQIQIGNSTQPTDDQEIYSISSIEAYPEFPGGDAAFTKFLSRNLKFPSLAAENSVEGKVIVSFIIEKTGELSNIKILRSIGFGCDEEAIRVLKKSPRWKAGIQNKQNVRVGYTIPINFKIPR